MSNVQIYGGFVIHIGSFRGKTGRLYIGEEVVCKVILCLLLKHFNLIVKLLTNQVLLLSLNTFLLGAE